MKQIKGIDVSKWQGVIDWGKVKASGVEFALIRATYGKTGIDERFTENVKGTQAAGIDVPDINFLYYLF